MIFGMTLCGWAPIGRIPLTDPHEFAVHGDWTTSATLFVANEMAYHFPHEATP